MKESFFKRLTGFLFAGILVLLSVLFFTNDFGLVDLRKSSVIIGIGIDCEGANVTVSAQLALPQPAENGENTQFSVVTGEGQSVAQALNDINGKTGYFPKLVFCKLIILGESCFGRDVKQLLNYFYSNEYTGLTAKLAAYLGDAGELMSIQLPYGDSSTDFVERLLSEEAQKSANVSTVDLNDFGQGYFSESAASYMPLIEMANGGEQKESESGGGQSESDGGQSGSGGGQSGSGGQSKSGEQEDIEFSCGKTVVFDKGFMKGVLGEDEAFAFNLLNGGIRHAYVACGEGDEKYVLRMRGCRGGVSLKVNKGVPVLKLSFSAVANIQDKTFDSKSVQNRGGKVPDNLLRLAEETLKGKMQALYKTSADMGSDVLKAKDMLYKNNRKYYDTFKDILFDKITVEYDVKLRSSG